MKDNDYIGFRDAALRARLERTLAQSHGMLKLSSILRAAVEEKLDQIDRDGLAAIFNPRAKDLRALSSGGDDGIGKALTKGITSKGKAGKNSKV